MKLKTTSCRNLVLISIPFLFNTLFAQEPGNLLSYSVYPASVELQCSQAKVRITAYADDIFRMDIRPDNVIFDPLPVPELSDSLLSFSFQVDDSSTTLNIGAPGYSIEFQKSPFSFIVRDPSGKTVLELENHGLQWNSGNSEIRFKMQPDDHFYGFGEKSIDLDRRGHAFGMRNQAIFGYDGPLAEMNINIPFFLSLQGYGMYFHMSYPGYFDMGQSDPAGWFYRSGGEPWMQFYVFVADHPKNILQSYTWLNGRSPLPPAWAFGFVQSKFGYQNEWEARQVITTFRQKGIPLDGLILDLFWFTNMGDFQWELSRFPDPSQMINDFLLQGVRTILITEPYIMTNSINYNLAANNGYLGQTLGGQTYILPSFWYGSAALLDFTNPSAQPWCWNLYDPLVNQGVGGWWTDLCEPELHPDDMQHYWGEAQRIHNVMNLLWSQLLYDHYQQSGNQRLFNLTRSGYAGSQRYGVITWSGDVQRSFGGLQVQPVLMQSLALSGIPYHNSDIGGFAGPATTPELYARWIQYGAFCPLMRPHSSFQSVEPWAFTTEVENISTSFIKLRASLFPYNYSYAYQTWQSGISIVRPLVLEYPQDTHTYNLDDQYLWGESFLIAPVMGAGWYPINVYLPEGQWVNFWTDETYLGNQTMSVNEPLSGMPIFVKAGSIIPRCLVKDFILDSPADTLIIELYPGNQGSFSLYEDDGLTLAYQQEAYALTRLAFNRSSTELELSVGTPAGSYADQPDRRTLLYVIHLSDGPPDSVVWNGRTLSNQADSLSLMSAGEGWTYDSNHHRIYVLGDHLISEGLTATVSGFNMLNRISSPQKISGDFRLYQNYPNPFNPVTTIEFTIPQTGFVSLKVYNLLGEEVATLLSASLLSGSYKYEWNARGLASGVYFYRLDANNHLEIKKCLLLK
jgi:alpha-glucosidase (family GH31 glycosyl hydrolase)